MYVADKELRSAIKPQRDAIFKLLEYYTDLDLCKIGDTEIQLAYSFDNCYQSISLECDYSGNWWFIELQDESGRDNYRYSQDLELDYKSPANSVVNALFDIGIHQGTLS
jgi:hypothetical protein